MSAKILFVLSSDPRVSHRPAEAIRIAAGVGVWQTAEIKVYLHGPAVLLLREAPGTLVDENEVTRHLSMLNESGQPVYVQSGSSFLGEINRVNYRHEKISEQQLAELAAQSNYLLHF